MKITQKCSKYLVIIVRIKYIIFLHLLVRLNLENIWKRSIIKQNGYCKILIFIMFILGNIKQNNMPICMTKYAISEMLLCGGKCGDELSMEYQSNQCILAYVTQLFSNWVYLFKLFPVLSIFMYTVHLLR